MRESSALRSRRRSAARRRMRPRSTGFSRAQAGCAARAASMASSTTFGARMEIGDHLARGGVDDGQRRAALVSTGRR